MEYFLIQILVIISHLCSIYNLFLDIKVVFMLLTSCNCEVWEQFFLVFDYN